MIYDIKTKEDLNLTAFYTQAMSELDDFYQLNWIHNQPDVYILNTQEDIYLARKDLGLSEFKTVTGWINNGNIFVVSKEIYRELMGDSNLDKRYLMLIKHELSHLFYLHVSQFQLSPDWLWEGCAIYLSGQLEFKKVPNQFINFLDYYEQKPDGGVYDESGFIIKFLIDKFGNKKLLDLIKNLKAYNTEEKFRKLFYNTYGFELDYTFINNQN